MFSSPSLDLNKSTTMSTTLPRPPSPPGRQQALINALVVLHLAHGPYFTRRAAFGHYRAAQSPPAPPSCPPG